MSVSGHAITGKPCFGREFFMGYESLVNCFAGLGKLKKLGVDTGESASKFLAVS